MKRFRIGNRFLSTVIFAWSQDHAERSQLFAWLMGEGTIYEIVTVTEIIPEPFQPDPYR